MAKYRLATEAALGALSTTVSGKINDADLISRSTNLFDLDAATLGQAYTAGVAAPVASGTNAISDYIPITQGASYVFSGVSRVTWFDAAKVYISDNGGLGVGTARAAPALAAFARITFAQTNLATAQVNAGTVLAPYERGRPPRVDIARLPKTTGIEADQTAFFDIASNLYDDTTVTIGKVISGGGAVTDNASYVISDFIPVQSATNYTYGGSILRVTYYDAAKAYLGEFSFATFPTTRMTPPRTRYARLSVAHPFRNAAQMNAGTALATYTKGGIRLKPRFLASTSKPIIDTDLSGVFDSNVTYPDIPTIGTATPGTVHALYDALVTAHPSYVTRTQIGTVDTLPIYRYDFAPVQPENASIILPTVPVTKVLIVTGTHGNEKASIWTAYHLMENLCNAWDDHPTLGALRQNVHFIVVPVANPTGVRDSTRKNAAGVDLARNWPTQWVQGAPTDSTYGGTAPLSEPETLAVKGILDTEATLLLVADFHNFHDPADSYEFLWSTPANARTAEIVNAHVKRMDRKWKADEPTLVNQDPNVFIGSVGAVPGGSLGVEASARGVAGALTFEHCHKIAANASPAYSSLAMTWGYEAWVNFLTMCLTGL